MATRSMIAVDCGPDHLLTIYCHYDGYNHSDGVGPTLRKFYNSLEKAMELVHFGNLRCINKDKPEPFSNPLKGLLRTGKI